MDSLLSSVALKKLIGFFFRFENLYIGYTCGAKKELELSQTQCYSLL